MKFGLFGLYRFFPRKWVMLWYSTNKILLVSCFQVCTLTGSKLWKLITVTLERRLEVVIWKFVGSILSEWGPEILKCSEWLKMGPNAYLGIPTRCRVDIKPKLLSKSMVTIEKFPKKWASNTIYSEPSLENKVKEPICYNFSGHFAIFTILLDNNLGYVWTQHLVGTPREALELILSHSEHLK